MEEIKKVVNQETSLEQIHIDKMQFEDWIYLLMHSDLEFFSYEAFKRLMKIDWVQNKIAQDLLERYGCFEKGQP